MGGVKLVFARPQPCTVSFLLDDIYINGVDRPDLAVAIAGDNMGWAGVSGGGTNLVKFGITSTSGRQQLESSSNVQTSDWLDFVSKGS